MASERLFSAEAVTVKKVAALAAVQAAVAALSPEEVSADPAVLDRVVEGVRLSPPTLNRDRIAFRAYETEVEDRDVFSRPRLCDGIAVEFRVPFEGDPTFFRFWPNSLSLNLPALNLPEGRVEGDELVLAVSAASPTAEDVLDELWSRLNRIEEILQDHGRYCEGMAGELRRVAVEALAERASRLSRLAEICRRLAGEGLVHDDPARRAL